ncbi:multiple epidermal growth factor-like domains protein 10 [Ptychodera flava]|uniref:multiple epidermal growth factor-like domains protein 10 n=1 Tax=Ptychodera flava TaxID=63121 RepID=UPI00396A24EE
MHNFCEDNCLHCYNGNDCRPQDKSCICTPGWYGDRCNHQCGYDNERSNVGMTCPENCLECNNDTGDCISCVAGWIGINCELPYLLSDNGVAGVDTTRVCICPERSDNSSLNNSTRQVTECTSSNDKSVFYSHILIIVILVLAPGNIILLIMCAVRRMKRTRNTHRIESPMFDYSTIDYTQMTQINRDINISRIERSNSSGANEYEASYDSISLPYQSLQDFSMDKYEIPLKEQDHMASKLAGVLFIENVSQRLNGTSIPTTANREAGGRN